MTSPSPAGVVLAWLALMLGACDSAGPGSPAPATTVVDAGPAEPTVTLRVNGEVARLVPYRELRERALVAHLLSPELRDPSTWKEVSASSASGAKLVVAEPRVRLRGREVAFFAGHGGEPALGVFRQLAPGMSVAARAQLSQPSLFVHHVAFVDVWTVPPPAPVVEAPPPGVPMRVDGEDRVIELNEKHLMTVDQVSPEEVKRTLVAGRRGEVKDKKHVHRGWQLRRVIRGLVQPRDVAQVTLVETKGRVVVIDGAALEDKDTASRYLLLLNERNALNYHGLKPADGGVPAIDRLRDLAGIRITRR